ncbi:MAG: M28 family peptidase [Metallosphaera sp.]
MKLARSLLDLGEAIHGGPVESKILSTIEDLFPDHVSYEVSTKYWEVRQEEIIMNGERIRSVALPYTSGCLHGKIGREIGTFEMPFHPFDLKKIHLDQYEAVVIHGDKLRRVSIPQGSPPTFFTTERLEGDVDLCSDTRLVETKSRNVEVTVREGDSYVVIGAHVDHWLTGFHDNLLSVQLLVDLYAELQKVRTKHGIKLVFFSSEEGPRCCTGSTQYHIKDLFAIISLDAIYPFRVVFSATPDLWFLSKNFNLKRVEMPTPFSDHFSFVQRGIPGMVLYNDDMIPVYHSDEDLPVPGDEEYLDQLKSSLTRTLIELDSRSKDSLDAEFMSIAKQSGYLGDSRENAIVPDIENLTSKFRKT